jgi:hypothetical protein
LWFLFHQAIFNWIVLVEHECFILAVINEHPVLLLPYQWQCIDWLRLSQVRSENSVDFIYVLSPHIEKRISNSFEFFNQIFYQVRENKKLFIVQGEQEHAKVQ